MEDGTYIDGEWRTSCNCGVACSAGFTGDAVPDANPVTPDTVFTHIVDIYSKPFKRALELYTTNAPSGWDAVPSRYDRVDSVSIAAYGVTMDQARKIHRYMRRYCKGFHCFALLNIDDTKRI